MNTDEQMISVVIAMLVWVAIWLVFMHHVARTIIPPGSIGFDGEKFFEPGTYKTLYEVKIIDLSPAVTTVKAGTKTLLITWIPDRQNLPAFLRIQNVSFQLVNLYASLPNPELTHYQALWGFKILKIEGNTPTKNAESIEIGEGVEIPY